MNNSVVFYSRDFLSIEFPKLKDCFPEFTRIYIVCNSNEELNVKKIDPDALVYKLGSFKDYTRETYEEFEIPELDFNNDRFLRNYSNDRLQKICSEVKSIIFDIVSNYSVKFYLDEPVSGYANFSFNKEFKKHGACCIHFQTSWIPNYMFLVSDSAQAEPIELNEIKVGHEIVRNHKQIRDKGSGRPYYVLNYNGRFRKIKDIILLKAKNIGRKLLRHDYYYLDNDTYPHKFHVRALTNSLYRDYTDFRINERTKKGKYVIFPLHYEPESVLNYFSKFHRQEEIAAQILDSLPLGYSLILKEHPSQPGALFDHSWFNLRRSERTILLSGNYNVNEILNSLDVTVVSIGSTMALEAVLHGNRVGVLGDVHFSKAPGIVKLNSASEWVEILNREKVSPAEILNWYSEFINKYCFRGNLMKNRSDTEALKKILISLVKH